jgi:uncharacterized membrane protein
MQDASMPPPPADPEYCVVSRRNNSLRRGQRWALFASLAWASLGIALMFAAAGAWPVLPYSMLEIGVLAGAFTWVERRSRDWERLTVAGDRVFVERAAGGQFSMREWNRAWLRVEVAGMGAGGTSGAPGVFPRGDVRLTLRYAGEAIEFGAALPPDERVRVARSLRRLTARW